MKEKITKAEFINTWASEWDEITGWKVSEIYHQQISEQLESLINQEVEKRIKEMMPTEEECIDWAKDETLDIDGGDNKRITFYLMVGCKWFRNRMKGGNQ